MLGFPMLTNLKLADLGKGTVLKVMCSPPERGWEADCQRSHAHHTTISMCTWHLGSPSVYTAAFLRSTLRVFRGLTSGLFFKKAKQSCSTKNRTYIYPPL